MIYTYFVIHFFPKFYARINIIFHKKVNRTENSTVVCREGQQDGIDDRMGEMKDVNGDGQIDKNDITAENYLRNWPYYVVWSEGGEAYGWGLWDTTEEFANKVIFRADSR